MGGGGRHGVQQAAAHNYLPPPYIGHTAPIFPPPPPITYCPLSRVHGGPQLQARVDPQHRPVGLHRLENYQSLGTFMEEPLSLLL